MMALSAVMNVALWFWLLFNIRPQEDPIFLHYNVLFGVDLIGPWYHILALPTVGLCMLFINAALGWFFFERDKFVSLVLQMTTVLAHFFLLIAASLLVFLNV